MIHSVCEGGVNSKHQNKKFYQRMPLGDGKCGKARQVCIFEIICLLEAWVEVQVRMKSGDMLALRCMPSTQWALGTGVSKSESGLETETDSYLHSS